MRMWFRIVFSDELRKSVIGFISEECLGIGFGQAPHVQPGVLGQSDTREAPTRLFEDLWNLRVRNAFRGVATGACVWG